MKPRAYNFGAGPAMLPESLLVDVQQELVNWQGSGRSIMEIGHRTSEFQRLMENLERDVRELLAVPSHYHVLFLGGAARLQFAQIALNLLDHSQPAGYLISGVWSSLAYAEAHKLFPSTYSIANSAAKKYPANFSLDTQNHQFYTFPSRTDWELQENSAYIYYTPNETVNGVRFSYVPQWGNAPLIADMTSCLFSEQIDINQYQLIFAGAQKNIGIAGLTLVIIHQQLLEERPQKVLPSMLDYEVHVKNHSLFATPPTFSCYIASKMMQWLKNQGGITAIAALNQQKSAKLYAYIDSSSFYHCKVAMDARSLTNVCFYLKQAELEDQFQEEAQQKGLYALQGHRLVGGLRASLYNAMPLSGVEALIKFMECFAAKYG